MASQIRVAAEKAVATLLLLGAKDAARELGAAVNNLRDEGWGECGRSERQRVYSWLDHLRSVEEEPIERGKWEAAKAALEDLEAWT